MAALKTCAGVSDLRLAARRRLPRFAFDFIDGGAGGEDGLRRNETDFSAIQLMPRYMRDVSDIRLETELFGKSYAVPFGAAPIGFMNTAWPGTDLALAKLAAKKRMAFGVSTACSTPLEAMAEAGEGFGWFQLYAARDAEISDNLTSRASAAGYHVLMVTVDVPMPGRRYRDIRNALNIPFHLTPRICLDLALHPRWAVETLRAGAPAFANMKTGPAAEVSLPEIQWRMCADNFTWDKLKKLRDDWPGALIVKGLMDAGDARLAAEIGCDGVIVSNHGGRQADFAPSAISALPDVAEALAGRAVVLMDSGVRSGADIIRAKALGADAVFAGRAFAFGAAAGGPAGLERAFEILESETRLTLGQIEEADFHKVDKGVIAP